VMEKTTVLNLRKQQRKPYRVMHPVRARSDCPMGLVNLVVMELGFADFQTSKDWACSLQTTRKQDILLRSGTK